MRDHVVATAFRPRALWRTAILFAVAWGLIGTGTAHAGGSVTVMTQNLYQGTEFAHIRVLATSEEPVSFNEAIAATTADYGTYLATRFKDRAKQIAAEITQNKPVLVGMQEVATWHKGEFNPGNPFGLPSAVSEDFTKVLVEALKADGMHYQAVSTTSRPEGNFTLAFPVAPGPPPFGLTAVGMVERGVILARTDLSAGQLQLSNPQSGTYSCEFCKVTLENPITKEVIPFTDSWESIDANVQGRAFRFITTHLDALEPSGIVRYLQAKELLEGPANTSLPVVVTGDMNSGPKTEPEITGPAAYGAFIEGGLGDTWIKAGLGAPPLTCCHLAFEDLVNDPKAEYTVGNELDHVLTRGNFPVVNEHLVGSTVPSPAPKPFIWPSDHAGMVATLGFGSCGVRWHYSANGSSGSWSVTGAKNCEQAINMGPQAMQGNLKVNPGAAIKVGYDFTLPTNKSPFTVSFTGGKVVFAVHCVSGATPSEPTFTATLPTQSYSVTNANWYPSGEQNSPLVYQGEVAAPNLCGGGQLRLDQGGTFSASMTIQ